VTRLIEGALAAWSGLEPDLMMRETVAWLELMSPKRDTDSARHPHKGLDHVGLRRRYDTKDRRPTEMPKPTGRWAG